VVPLYIGGVVEGVGSIQMGMCKGVGIEKEALGLIS
jgi:hypothetical protein